MNSSSNPFTNPGLCRELLACLERELDRPMTFMEVCGTHTVAIFRSGLKSVLPAGIRHLSGPGCPVCVTHDREVAAILNVAAKNGVMIATFGDLMRVPGPDGKSLKSERAAGARVEVVYSPLDALALAAANPELKVVFLGVGFETTAPAVAATIQKAALENIRNFFVLSMHKLVPPVLEALLDDESHPPSPSSYQTPAPSIDAFLLPGHVSAVLGVTPYRFMAEKYKKPAVIGGFEALDIVQSLLMMIRMIKEGKPAVKNEYNRVVTDDGNARAREILFSVFEREPGHWRGLGLIPDSGLAIRPEYEAFDAWKHFGLSLPDVSETRGCRCGLVLKGAITPCGCPLFAKACTPANPIGPCMVSSEGSCAAYYAYNSEVLA